jgi:hypothetical protein
MRKIFELLSVVLLAACLLSACVPPIVSSTGGSTNAALGPDGIAQDQGKSSLPARIKAGLSWLWASYTRLHDAGAVPGLDDLKADILDLEAVATRGDLMAALELYGRARARVTAIAAAVGK